MKVFDRETYLEDMNRLYPEAKERRREYLWPHACDGMPVEQCRALGYGISDAWLKDVDDTQYMIVASFIGIAKALGDRYLGTDGCFHSTYNTPPLLFTEEQALIIAKAFSNDYMVLGVKEKL
jgi:hypothetical protein